MTLIIVQCLNWNVVEPTAVELAVELIIVQCLNWNPTQAGQMAWSDAYNRTMLELKSKERFYLRDDVTKLIIVQCLNWNTVEELIEHFNK